MERAFDEWRVGDQRYYVSDTHTFFTATGWRPQTSVDQGLSALHAWYEQQSNERPLHSNTMANASLVEARP
jgi:CDP-paratose 2-epimerase